MRQLAQQIQPGQAKAKVWEDLLYPGQPIDPSILHILLNLFLAPQSLPAIFKLKSRLVSQEFLLHLYELYSRRQTSSINDAHE